MVNNGRSPERRERETLSLSLERDVLPFNHLTFTDTLLSTYELREIVQITDRLVPAYRVEPSGRATATVGVGTAMK